MSQSKPTLRELIARVSENKELAHKVAMLWAGRTIPRVMPGVEKEPFEWYSSARFQKMVREVANWDLPDPSDQVKYAAIKACRGAIEQGAYLNLLEVCGHCILTVQKPITQDEASRIESNGLPDHMKVFMKEVFDMECDCLEALGEL